MADEYGSDFLTIVDEDGKEYELEVLSTLEYNGATYLAVVPAGGGFTYEYSIAVTDVTREDRASAG